MNVDKTTFTVGGLGYVTRDLSLFYNYSTTFNPSAARQNIYGSYYGPQVAAEWSAGLPANPSPTANSAATFGCSADGSGPSFRFQLHGAGEPEHVRRREPNPGVRPGARRRTRQHPRPHAGPALLRHP